MNDSALSFFTQHAPEYFGKFFGYFAITIVSFIVLFSPFGRRATKWAAGKLFEDERAKEELRALIDEQKKIVERQEKIMIELTKINEKTEASINRNNDTLREVAQFGQLLHEMNKETTEIKERLSFIEGTLNKRK